MKHLSKKRQSCFALFLSIVLLISSFLTNVQIVRADTPAPTPPKLISAVTNHIGKEVILTFDKPMADPAGTEGQFTVKGTSLVLVHNNGAVKLTPTYPNGAVPVSSAALGSDSTQIRLKMERELLPPGTITIDYNKGGVKAADGTELENFTNYSVTNNNISSNDITDFDLDATEIAYDPSNSIIKFRFDKPIDYDNVQLAWYLHNGFFDPMVDDVNNYVEFYEKDNPDNKVVLPNLVTQNNIPTLYPDGTMQNEKIVTDWYFWQIQQRVPLGLNLISRALKPSTTYVIQIDKGFKYQNGSTVSQNYYFEFTTMKDSLTKPYWVNGSNVTVSNVTENGLTLSWPAVQDNHEAVKKYTDVNNGNNTTIINIKYNIYQNDTLLTTVDGNTTSYDVTNLSQGTKYSFTVEAVDFANNKSITNLTAAQTTAGMPPAPSVTADDAANKLTGINSTMEYSIDNGAWTKYTADPDLSGNHTVKVRVSATETNPAGFSTSLTFTANPPAPAAPDVTADDTANKIIGINSTMEYSIDGGAWTKYTSDPKLTGNHTVKVRISADAVTGTPAGAVKTLNFTAVSSIPQTGSPLDFLALMLIGISILGAGIFITVKKCRRNIQ